MSDARVKEYVRRRDGYRCRLCGMSGREHVEKYETDLHVHRLVPGIAYYPYWCVTLCRDCHGAMPRKTLDAVTGDPIETFSVAAWFNLFDPEAYDAIETAFLIAKRRHQGRVKASILHILHTAVSIGLKRLAATDEFADGAGI